MTFDILHVMTRDLADGDMGAACLISGRRQA